MDEDVLGNSSLQMIDESIVARLVSPHDTLQEMREIFRKLADGSAVNFPVIREQVGASVFGVKSGSYLERGILGLKAGGYFPANAVGGDNKHQSVVVLFHAETGRPTAMVDGNLITRLRTAAAAALSIDLIARVNASTLAVIGIGAQAEAHVRAACDVRQFSRVILWNRSEGSAQKLAGKLKSSGIEARAEPSLQATIEEADVLVTLTSATAAIVRKEWIKPGTHLACMGADTVGKQEIDELLVAAARVFTDSVGQALAIGECQAGQRKGLFGREHIVGTLGDVLLGVCEGRRGDAEITIFDGTGMAVQDLVMADLVVRRMSDSMRRRNQTV